MYSKIPAEVNPTPTSAKLTYANAFDSDFCLLLRERRCATLADMQDATLEVESNIMVAEKLKSHDDRRRQRGQASYSSASYSEPKLDKMTKMIESLAAEISKLKVEQSSGKARFQKTFAPRNPNSLRRPQNPPRLNKGWGAKIGNYLCKPTLVFENPELDITGKHCK